MGLLKKIAAKPSLQSVYRRRKAAEAKLKGDDDQEKLSSAQFIVTSYPKEYSDTSSCPGCTASTTSSDPISTNNKQIDASSPPDSNENSGGWSWLISCWGSSFLLGSKAPTDDRTYDSTSSSSNEEDDDGVDGGSGDSSHSMSRIDTVLNLGNPDDVSDITSAASVDDSLSDSEDGDDDDDEGDLSVSGSR